MSRIIFGTFSSAVLLAAPFLEPILFPLAWVAFVPLFWTIAHAKNLRQAFFCGWLAGFIAHLAGFYWLVYTISVFGGFSYPISAIVFLVYAALRPSNGHLCVPVRGRPGPANFPRYFGFP
jgi:apolipoprotein N-acyltransferase